MRRPTATLAGSLLALILTAGCGSGDASSTYGFQTKPGAEAANAAGPAEAAIATGPATESACRTEIATLLGPVEPLLLRGVADKKVQSEADEKPKRCLTFTGEVIQRIFREAVTERLAASTSLALGADRCRSALAPLVEPIVAQQGGPAANFRSVTGRLNAAGTGIPAACASFKGLGFTRLVKAAILRAGGSAAEETTPSSGGPATATETSGAAKAEAAAKAKADPTTRNTARRPEAGAGSAQRSTCKAAVAKQSRRNFDIILASGDPEDPRLDRSEPRACAGLDQGTKTRIAREVADELAQERQRRP